MKRRNIILIIFIFILMALQAGAENMINIFIPTLKNEFAISNANIGTMISLGSLGYVAFTFIGGILCDKIGQKKVFIFGILFLIISLFLYANTNSYFMLIIDMFILNVGLSLASIAINTLVPVLVMSFQAILMNMTHFFYGAGSAAGQGIGGFLSARGVNWRSIYFGLAVMFIIALICIIFIKVPDVHKNEKENKIGLVKVLKNKLVIFYILALGFYVFGEIGTYKWLTNYIYDNYNYSQSRAAFYVTLFTVIFAVGRLFGGIVVEKLGYVNTVLKSLIIACLMYTIGIIFKQNGLIIISISGLFFAITFPTLILSISKVFKSNVSSIIGIIITFTSLINMVMQMIIGILNDYLGTYSAFYIIPISLGISILFIALIYLNTKESFVIGRE
ncbi:inner membrane protein YbjJ [Clostridium tepidiprofundi DSM 19306]|uniref:Inner membrane protein YbjJ n=1 Tax=Clostridium tepidiprofundi DSM 19306 TaxID=1121338 RepID=A0A151AVN4_9CLOT|nr:MFS transporter [Clostridium tepidiprofundi]KYH31671.1 inner membrane protein YbjJ [Clostridium tepidiprofundi DSM 19306]